jgi:hypothetical protein
MSHDRIRKAARERMARTGESFAAARRRVVEEYRGLDTGPHPSGGTWFALSHRAGGLYRVSAWLNTLQGVGPERSGVMVGREEIRVRAGRFSLEVPRSRITDARRSLEDPPGTTGVHHRGGRWLVNGGPDGLVEVAFAPGVHVRPQFSSQYQRTPVERLTVSLVDPDGFIAALGFGGDDAR